MFSHLSPRHQLGMAAICGTTLFGVAFVGGQYARRPPDITVTSQPAQLTTPPSVVSKPQATPPEEVVVHVAGAVKAPKVVHLPPGSRVEDAIEAAGGAKPEADLEMSLNLAEKLVDGQKVYVHNRSEKDLPLVETLATAAPVPISPTVVSPKATAVGGKVSLNTATAADLDSLPGVGPATAKKILEYRQDHGGFGSIEEIRAVKGIGEKKFAAMKDRLKL